MTSFRFPPALRTASFLALLLLAGASASTFAADDLPAPRDGSIDELPAAPDSSPQLPLADENEMPAPSLGTEGDLPAATGGPLESDANQVNKVESSDNIYLPNPAGSSDFNSAPLSSAYGAPVYASNEAEWKSGLSTRPIFTLSAGLATRNYATVLVEGTTPGYGVSASFRLFDLGQTVFLHALGGASFFDVGDVAIGAAGPSYDDVRDKTYHLGAMLELGVGRRLSLFGSLMRRWNTITYNPPTGSDTQKAAILAQRDPRQLEFIGEKAALKLGIGGQYDFYVIPHGSIGLQARVEKDFYYLGLTMSVEPAPRKKPNLNFESIR